MPRYLVTISFLIAFAVQTFSHALMVAEYYANPEAYAVNCVNKAKPRLKCAGKCQLMKKLEASEQKERQLPEGKRAPKNEVISSKSFFVTAVAHQLPWQPVYPVSLLQAIPAGRVQEIFHPPAR